MKPILRDTILEKELKEKGYVVIPFLTKEETTELKNFYYEYHSPTLEGMYATAHVPDIDLRMKMNDKIKEVFSRAIEETFCHATALGGSFIAKGKGNNGTLKPHQDWNIVNEEKYRSFNIWVPLVDLTDNNGAICVMPQSHLWQKTFRSANTPSVFQNIENELWDAMKKLYMKAGEALIYDHRLLHASGNNNTDEIRLATVFGIIPDEAEMMYYHQKDEHTIQVYKSNPEFFLYGNIFEGPQGLKLISEMKYYFQTTSNHDFETLRSEKHGILDKLRMFFVK